MTSETALLVITGLVALSLFAQHILPFVVEYLGTEQDRWFARSVHKRRVETDQYSVLFEHLTETTRTQAQIVATLQSITQTQTELMHQIATIDKSLIVLVEKYTEVSSEMNEIKNYAERITDMALGLSYERRKNSTPKSN